MLARVARPPAVPTALDDESGPAGGWRLRLVQPFVRRAAGVENPERGRGAGRPSSRQVQDSIGAQAASKAAARPGSEPRAGAAGREHGENPPFDTAEHYGFGYRFIIHMIAVL